VTLTQRAIAAELGVSLGKANQLIRQAAVLGYLTTPQLELTQAGRDYLEPFKVAGAIVLAAGFGSRAVPLTFETPKGLLLVRGEPMTERLIRQLQAAGVPRITLVVGYLKERFEYLTDKYGVELVFNPEFATKNNLTSLYCVRDRLAQSYVLVADNWLETNPFNRYEPDSWMGGLYAAGPTSEWTTQLGPKGRIKGITIGGADTPVLLGPSFFSADFAAEFVPLLERAYATPGTEDWYFEHVLWHNLKRLPIYLRLLDQFNLHEFENLAELRQFDTSYQADAHSAIMRQIAQVLDIPQSRISGIEPLKNGLMNASFQFRTGRTEVDRFVFRRPQPGAAEWVDYAAERSAYATLAPLGLTDELVWIDPADGHRITRFLTGARPLDPSNPDELRAALETIAQVHHSGLVFSAEPPLTADLDRLRRLAQSRQAIQFADYPEVDALVRRAAALPANAGAPTVPTHGDYTASNVLVLPDGSIRLIDWELAGQRDPLTDVASFVLAAGLDSDAAAAALTLYTGRLPARDEWVRFHTQAALVALANTLWAEYRQALGEQLGEYPLLTYRRAKQHARAALGL
jgi:CTP:phosphocholine cytidylyltransferase-like protein/thiamine kinase-like enzyme